MSEERVINEKTGGAKGRKDARMDLLPWDMLWQLSKVYAFGAAKYTKEMGVSEAREVCSCDALSVKPDAKSTQGADAEPVTTDGSRHETPRTQSGSGRTAGSGTRRTKIGGGSTPDSTGPTTPRSSHSNGRGGASGTTESSPRQPTPSSNTRNMSVPSVGANIGTGTRSTSTTTTRPGSPEDSSAETATRPSDYSETMPESWPKHSTTCRLHQSEKSGDTVTIPGDHNWRKGYDWSLSYAAAQRHLAQFWSGEAHDRGSGLLHVLHAAFHCLALAFFYWAHPGLDDRPKQVEHPWLETAMPLSDVDEEEDRVSEQTCYRSMHKSCRCVRPAGHDGSCNCAYPDGAPVSVEEPDLEWEPVPGQLNTWRVYNHGDIVTCPDCGGSHMLADQPHPDVTCAACASFYGSIEDLL